MTQIKIDDDENPHPEKRPRFESGEEEELTFKSLEPLREYFICKHEWGIIHFISSTRFPRRDFPSSSRPGFSYTSGEKRSTGSHWKEAIPLRHLLQEIHSSRHSQRSRAQAYSRPKLSRVIFSYGWVTTSSSRLFHRHRHLYLSKKEYKQNMQPFYLNICNHHQWVCCMIQFLFKIVFPRNLEYSIQNWSIFLSFSPIKCVRPSGYLTQIWW